MVKESSSLLEVEIDGAKNQSLFFRPLQRRLRGRLDVNRVAEPEKYKLLQGWPEPVPGLRLGIDTATGEAYVAEPLHDCPTIRARVEKRGQQILPARETIAGAHLPTWLFWIKSAVAAGLARVTKGTIPATIEGEPRKSFLHAPPANKTNDRLAAALETNNLLLAEVLKRLK